MTNRNEYSVDKKVFENLQPYQNELFQLTELAGVNINPLYIWGVRTELRPLQFVLTLSSTSKSEKINGISFTLDNNKMYVTGCSLKNFARVFVQLLNMNVPPEVVYKLLKLIKRSARSTRSKRVISSRGRSS